MSLKYSAEATQLADIMSERIEGLPLRYPEIEQLIGLPITNPQFHAIITTVIVQLAERKVPVIRIRRNGRSNLPGGIVRLSPRDKVQDSYDRITKGLNRVADAAFRDVGSVDVASLAPEDQNVAIAVLTTAKMAQIMATKDTQEKLQDQIRAGENQKVDTRSTIAKLFQHNL